MPIVLSLFSCCLFSGLLMNISPKCVRKEIPTPTKYQRSSVARRTPELEDAVNSPRLGGGRREPSRGGRVDLSYAASMPQMARPHSAEKRVLMLREATRAEWKEGTKQERTTTLFHFHLLLLPLLAPASPPYAPPPLLLPSSPGLAR